MKLYDKLNEIEKKYPLTKDLKLRIIHNDNTVSEGFFDGYTDALNNEPEITQLEITKPGHPSIYCIYETDMQDIEVIE